MAKTLSKVSMWVSLPIDPLTSGQDARQTPFFAALFPKREFPP